MMHASSQPGFLEWLLNALWLLLTVAVAWTANRRRSRCLRPRDRAVTLVAIACAATIVFPAISVSDDLYDSWAIEDSGLKIKKPEPVVRWTCAVHTMVFALMLAFSPSPARQAPGDLPTHVDLKALCWYIVPSAGRAPPQT